MKMVLAYIGKIHGKNTAGKTKSSSSKKAVIILANRALVQETQVKT